MSALPTTIPAGADLTPARMLAKLLDERFAGRRTAYARRGRNKKGDWEYWPARPKKAGPLLPLTINTFERHLSGAEEDAIGVFLFDEGGSDVRFAAIDIDNGHGDNPTLPWPELVKLVQPLHKLLNKIGDVLAVRSGGGQGIHLVLFFEHPVAAAAVRKHLLWVLEQCGLRIDANSSGGIRDGVVEVFPKQDHSRGGKGFANLIALPFARQSVPLDDNLEPLLIDMALERLAAVPFYVVPEPGSSTATDDPTPADNVVPFRAPGRKLFDVKAALKGVSEGSRDQLLWSLACKLRADDVPQDEAEQMVSEAAANCEPPVEKAVAIDKVRRAYALYPPNKKTTRDPADPAVGDAEVATLNQEFAYVVAGDKARVLIERPNEGPAFWTLDAFRNLYCNRFVEVGRRDVPLGEFWLKHPQRRSYNRIVFRPGQDVPHAYNMWSGFAFEPGEGDCSLFLDHIHQNVASGDPKIAQWIVGWFAQMFQQPMKKTGTSLVLKGVAGSGKTFVGKQIGRLLGNHYGLFDNPNHITGQFTSQLENKILVHADEALFAADPRIVSRLRSMVTSDKTVMERKGLDAVHVENYMRLLISSDKEWAVPAALEERRFAVLEMGEGRMQDRPYFIAIEAQLEAGGYQALLKYLLEFDLNSVDLGELPKTNALADEKVNTMGGAARFWHRCLDDGEIVPDSDEWPDRISKTQMHELYQSEAQKVGDRRRLTAIQFGTELKKLCPALRPCKVLVDKTFTDKEGQEVSVTKYVHGYEVPTLLECRELFDQKARQPLPWKRIDPGAFG